MNDTVPTTGAIPFPRTGGTLPVPTVLTAAQSDGLACVYCGRDYRRDPVPSVPVGVSRVGQTFACTDESGRQTCGVVEAAPVDEHDQEHADNLPVDQADTVTVPLSEFAATVADSMTGMTTEALAEMVAALVMVGRKSVRREAAAEAARLAEGCPPWCDAHAAERPDEPVCHLGARVDVAGVTVQACLLVEGGQPVERTVFLGDHDLTVDQARELADVLRAEADHVAGTGQ